MHDQAERLRQMVQKTSPVIHKSAVIKCSGDTRSRVITITSGKGGVGKTNITVNLALALAKIGKKVLIIDADLGLANVDVVLGCSSPYNILNLLEDCFHLADIVTDGPRGIKFMSGGSGIYQLANLNDAQLQYIISQITLFDEWADIILIDTGAGLSRNVLNFVMAADEVIVVTTPEPTSITDAYAMMKAYSQHQGTAPMHLIVNRAVDIQEGGVVIDKLTKLALRFLGLPISGLGIVYEDRNLVNAVKNQTPLLMAAPDSLAARCIDNIAHRIVNDGKDSTSQGIKGFFTRFLEMIW